MRFWFAVLLVAAYLLVCSACHYDNLINVDMRRECDCPTTSPATDDDSVTGILKEHLP